MKLPVILFRCFKALFLLNGLSVKSTGAVIISYEAVTISYDVVINNYEAVTISYDVVTNNYEAVTNNYEAGSD